MAVCVFFLWWPSVLNLAVIHPNELPLCDTHRISVAIEVETLHWATFLQLNIIDFPLLFPHPSIHSDISGSWGNIFKSMTLCLHFYLETFCPLFVVIGCRRFWTYLFAIAEFEVRPCIPQRHAMQGSGPTVCIVRGDWNSSGFAQRSSSTGNFALISLGTHI